MLQPLLRSSHEVVVGRGHLRRYEYPILQHRIRGQITLRFQLAVSSHSTEILHRGPAAYDGEIPHRRMFPHRSQVRHQHLFPDLRSPVDHRAGSHNTSIPQLHRRQPILRLQHTDGRSHRLLAQNCSIVYAHAVPDPHIPMNDHVMPDPTLPPDHRALLHDRAAPNLRAHTHRRLFADPMFHSFFPLEATDVPFAGRMVYIRKNMKPSQ